MAQVTYLGPHDAVEVPHLNWQVFKQGEAVEVPDEDVQGLADQPDTWQVANAPAKAPASAPAEQPAQAEGE